MVQWSRFTELAMDATPWAWQATPAGEVLTGLANTIGYDGCYVSARLHHPYGAWDVKYTHHNRTYKSGEIYQVRTLFHRVVAAKAAHRLGDPEWLAAAVDRLALHPARFTPTARRRVDEIIKELST